MNDNFILDNIIEDTDSYKVSHALQYPRDTRHISSYQESRCAPTVQIVSFGHQYPVVRYLTTPITRDNIEEAGDLWVPHMGEFNYEGWKYILGQHGGYLPLKIQAVPEGTRLGASNVLSQIINTDPVNTFWLTNYIETMWSRTWYPITVATQDHDIRVMIQRFLDATATDTNVLFHLHDFGSRGVSSKESAGIGGMAHLLNFLGTDTGIGLRYARQFYDEPMAGYSIPASEHSTITTWGRDHEGDAYENMLDTYGKPGQKFACVSDSYDIMAAIDKWYRLKDKIIASGSSLVIRPDSGEPVEDAVFAVMRRVLDKFGYEPNDKGYAVLPPYVRVIQGDGVNQQSINKILTKLKKHGISAENVSFGMGGALLQKLDRDTLKFAIKCSAIDRAGTWHDVYKDPIGDHSKASKRGILALIKEGGQYKTIRRSDLNGRKDHLQTIYENGRLYNATTLSEVRERLWS